MSNGGKGVLYKAAGLILVVIFIPLGISVGNWWPPSYGVGVGSIGVAVGILLFGVGEIITIMTSIKNAIDSTDERKEKEKEIESE